jgi:hypothetical protein
MRRSSSQCLLHDGSGVPTFDQSFVGQYGSLFDFRKAPEADIEARFVGVAMGQEPPPALRKTGPMRRPS